MKAGHVLVVECLLCNRLTRVLAPSLFPLIRKCWQGPDGSHPSHLVGGLHAQAKAGWETTFASEVLRLNREKM